MSPGPVPHKFNMPVPDAIVGQGHGRGSQSGCCRMRERLWCRRQRRLPRRHHTPLAGFIGRGLSRQHKLSRCHRRALAASSGHAPSPVVRAGIAFRLTPLSTIIVIPARMASTRLPGKPLASVGGQPMIVQVWRRAIEADVGRVVVAAADRSIADAVAEAGGETVMTDRGLRSGSDRVHQALSRIDDADDVDVVVNLQGDLPTLPPHDLGRVVATLTGSNTDLATLAVRTTQENEADNPSVVKVVVAWDNGEETGRALCFTRSRAPWGEGPLWHHVGVYAYRRAALELFVSLPTSALERRERLEQMRALEAGMSIAVGRVDSAPVGVDTPRDLEQARSFFC